MHECMDTVAVLRWSGILYKSFPFFWIINLLQTIYKQASYTRSAINSVPHYMWLIVSIAFAGAKEVDEQDDMFIIVAPQNAVGNCIIDVRNTENLLLKHLGHCIV